MYKGLLHLQDLKEHQGQVSIIIPARETEAQVGEVGGEGVGATDITKTYRSIITTPPAPSRPQRQMHLRMRWPEAPSFLPLFLCPVSLRPGQVLVPAGTL